MCGLGDERRQRARGAVYFEREHLTVRIDALGRDIDDIGLRRAKLDAERSDERSAEVRRQSKV